MTILNRTKKIQRLMDIGNRAKGIKGYDISNVAVAAIMDDVIGCDEEARNASVVYQTRDPRGEYGISQGYYDLICFEAGEQSICIPVPLVEKSALIPLMKAATIVDRCDHKRETRDAEKEEIESLWRELYAVVEREDLLGYVSLYLDAEERSRGRHKGSFELPEISE